MENIQAKAHLYTNNLGLKMALPPSPTFQTYQKNGMGAEYITLYPNVLLGVQRDHAFAIILEPKAHNKTLEHIHLYYASETTNPKNRSVNTKQWKELFEEDIFLVQGMQSGRYAPSFDGGSFSPVMDQPTHCYHDWVARKITTYRG